MNRDINSILEDLYKIDPHFKTQEPLLRKMIEELLRSQPDTKFDQRFAEQLRERLMASEIVTKVTQEKSVVSPFTSLFAFVGKTKWSYGLAGAIVLLVIILPFVDNNVETGLSLKQVINDRGSQTFGTLSYSSDFGRGALMQDSFSGNSEPAIHDGITAKNNAESDAQTMMAPAIAPDSVSEVSAGDGLSGRSGTFLPQVTRYVYVGKPFTFTETEGRVFMRSKGFEAGKQIASLLSQADFGLINLSSFDGLQARSVELVQHKPFGYSITANFDEGLLYIMPNWEQWNSNGAENSVSVDMGSREERELRHISNSVPNSETLVALANNFLKDHGIDVEAYGTPVVDSQFMEMISTDPTRSSIMPIYGGEILTVIYPLTISDMEVYDERGTLYGLQVNINIAENKVSGVNNLTSQLYDSSTYTLETDSQKILEYVTSPSDTYYGQNVTVQNIRLGTPTKVLMQFWDYNGGTSPRELYVPALRFPVVAGDVSQYYQTAVVIPLVKEMLERRQEPQPEPVPMPRPL